MMGDGFFKELRRRNVLRVGFVYLVAAWLILQVADLIVPILGVPEWSSKLIFLLLILGFPVSLILAWAFEITPEGLKKEKDVDRSQSITSQTGRKIDFVIIGALVLALAYSIYFKDAEPPSDTAVPVPAEDGTHSIAVLPLVNMSSDPETDYFSDGLAEELLNLLSKVDALRVAADKGYSVPHDLETPFFDDLKANPDFQAILVQVRANQAAMREKVLALDGLLPKSNGG